MTAPNVLFIRNSRGITDISGAETYLMALMQGLSEDGCETEALIATDSRRGRPLWLDRLDATGLPYQTVDITSPFSLADWWAVRDHAREMGADVVHAMDHRSDALAVALDRSLKIPAVASFFGWTNWTDASLRGRLYPMVDRALMRRLRRVITDSDFVGSRTGLPAERVAVIPNGVDTRRFDPDRVKGGLKSRWFGTEDVTVVGLIGRVHPNKGHVDLVRAAAALRPDWPDLRFVTLGATPPGHADYEADLHSAIAQADLADCFLVTNVDSREIPAAIASFDVTVLPSYMESLSYVMLESMAMGVPVISARVGGHAEVIDDGETGLLFESGDVPALTDRIARLLRDPGLRARLARAGRARVLERYSIAAMVARTRAVYEEVQCRRSRPPSLSWCRPTTRPA